MCWCGGLSTGAVEQAEVMASKAAASVERGIG